MLIRNLLSEIQFSGPRLYRRFLPPRGRCGTPHSVHRYQHPWGYRMSQSCFWAVPTFSQNISFKSENASYVLHVKIHREMLDFPVDSQQVPRSFGSGPTIPRSERSCLRSHLTGPFLSCYSYVRYCERQQLCLERVKSSANLYNTAVNVRPRYMFYKKNF